jgi:hypothetical protein
VSLFVLGPEIEDRDRVEVTTGREWVRYASSDFWLSRAACGHISTPRIWSVSSPVTKKSHFNRLKINVFLLFEIVELPPFAPPQEVQTDLSVDFWQKSKT